MYSFLGCKIVIKGFLLQDARTYGILISRNVKFFDLKFPFHSSSIILVPVTHIYMDICQAFVPSIADQQLLSNAS